MDFEDLLGKKAAEEVAQAKEVTTVGEDTLELNNEQLGIADGGAALKVDLPSPDSLISALLSPESHLSLVEPEPTPLFTTSLVESIANVFAQATEVTGIDFDPYRIVASPYDSPMNISPTNEAAGIGEKPTLYVRDVLHADFVLPHELGHAVHDAFQNPDRVLNLMAEGLAHLLAAEPVRDAHRLADALRETFTDGTGIALIAAGVSYSASEKSTTEILEQACEAFVAIAGSSELITSQEGREGQIFNLAREISAAESLLDKAVAAGVQGELLSDLNEIRNQNFAQLAVLGAAPHDQEALLGVFRNANRAGTEIALDGVQTELTLSMGALLSEHGAHCGTLSEYVRAVVEAHQGVGAPTVRDFLPGGEKFEEIQRQRERWGNEKFSYDASHELPPIIALEILKYLKEGESLSTEDAMARLEDFIQRSYG